MVPLMLIGINHDPAMGQSSADLAGCYQFDRAYFSWVGRRSERSIVVRDSTRFVRLREQAHPGASAMRITGALQLEPIPFETDDFTRDQWLGFSHWRLLSSDSVTVVWRNGLYGPVFRMAVRGDTLRGQVRFTTDVIGAEPQSQAAWAVRTECPDASESGRNQIGLVWAEQPQITMLFTRRRPRRFGAARSGVHAREGRRISFRHARLSKKSQRHDGRHRDGSSRVVAESLWFLSVSGERLNKCVRIE
jgi:hypothetical protein